jgi:hypothetical protein
MDLREALDRQRQAADLREEMLKQVCMCVRQCRSKGEGREADMQLCVSQVVVIHSALLSN